MDNQHRLIKGYRELSAEEIDLVNQIKTLAEQVGVLCLKLGEHVFAMPSDEPQKDADREEASRWLEEGELSLQTGFMQVTRAITRPESF